MLAKDGDSEIARYEGGRKGCTVGADAKSSVLVEAKESVAGEVSVMTVNSGETGRFGVELIFGVGYWFEGRRRRKSTILRNLKHRR